MSSGGGDQEVKQTSEPFRQQLPFVQQVFGLADARRRSLTPGATPVGNFNINPGIGATGGGFNFGGRFPGSFNFTNPIPNPPSFGGVGAPVSGPGGIDSNFDSAFRNRAAQFGLPTLEFYPGETVAGLSDDTIRGQLLARNGAANVAGNNEAATGAFNRLLSSNPFSNPALDSLLRNPDPTRDPTVEAFANAATDPLVRNRDALLGADDDRAIAQGAFGGSRQALTRGQIRNDFAERVGNVRSQIYNNAFNQQLGAQRDALAIAAGADSTNRNTQLSALSSLPTLNSAQTAPADIFSRVGAQRENFSQAKIDADRERFEFLQSAPDLALNQFSNLINQFSGPTTSNQVISGGGSSLGNIAGGALLGAGARSLFSR